ncbi:hypothetical protein AVEN_2660-1 [Araneus ventricosus]|uniref:Peptidase A2 domain-containing protein n=1 Tax=Araneus ventricosus TaxID=182803 RepID=A0A4Y2RHS5_ARAVE|nr:hypothetical protein AVEN_2660-1 [Araneus ventricosus]
MAFLPKHRKEELITLAEDMGIETNPTDKKIDICKKIKESPYFEEEFVRGCLEDIVKQREAETAELKTREAEALRQKREFELEKIKLTNAAEIKCAGSARSESVRPRRELRNLTQKYNAQVEDISLYLAMFERQAPTAQIEESELVSQLMALLPLDLAQIIIKEREDKIKGYLHIKGVLNYLEGWLDASRLRNFEESYDHLKRVSPEVKDHFLDEWALERKPVEKIRLVSPHGELKGKPLGNSGPPFRNNSTSKGNWRNENFESRKPAACYICHSTEHLWPNCPQLKKYQPVEIVNHVGMAESPETLFASYMSKALVNQTEMSILRDTGASIDLVSRNHINPKALTGETVWIMQQLDKNFTCLPLAKIELQSPEFGKIFIKAAVLDTHLDSDIYLLGNRSVKLIGEQRKTPKSNVVMTRNQNLKKETEAGPVMRTPPQGLVEENIPSFIEGELSPLLLPQAGVDINSLFKVSSETVASEQNNCTSLKSSWEKEKERKSEINNGLNSDKTVKETQTENYNDIFVSTSVTLNVESIPREINNEIKNDFYEKGESCG